MILGNFRSIYIYIYIRVIFYHILNYSILSKWWIIVSILRNNSPETTYSIYTTFYKMYIWMIYLCRQSFLMVRLELEVQVKVFLPVEREWRWQRVRCSRAVQVPQIRSRTGHSWSQTTGAEKKNTDNFRLHFLQMCSLRDLIFLVRYFLFVLENMQIRMIGSLSKSRYCFCVEEWHVSKVHMNIWECYLISWEDWKWLGNVSIFSSVLYTLLVLVMSDE